MIDKNKKTQILTLNKAIGIHSSKCWSLCFPPTRRTCRCCNLQPLSKLYRLYTVMICHSYCDIAIAIGTRLAPITTSPEERRLVAMIFAIVKVRDVNPHVLVYQLLYSHNHI